MNVFAFSLLEPKDAISIMHDHLANLRLSGLAIFAELLCMDLVGDSGGIA